MTEVKLNEKKPGIVAYLALIFAIVFFSGVFSKATNWLAIFDFSVLNGKFGAIATKTANITFTGTGGSGARDGLLFGLSLLPSVMLAIGVVEVVEYLGALKAARYLLTPILKPVLGLPGTAGLTLIASLQSTDAGGGMTKVLYDNGEIDDDQRTVFAAFQFSAGATITNFFATGAGLFALSKIDGSQAVVIPMLVPLILIFVLKLFGANLVRFYLKSVSKNLKAKSKKEIKAEEV